MSESEDPRFEFVDYYGNTSIFALRSILRHGEFKDIEICSASPVCGAFSWITCRFSGPSITSPWPRPGFRIPPDPSFHLLQQDFFSLPIVGRGLRDFPRGDPLFQ